MENNILSQYLNWHFFEAPREILKGWRNFLVFNLNYFSIPALLATFFSHWHGYYYPYGRGFIVARYFEAFVFNVFSRIIGAIFRTFFIIIGLLIEILIIFAGLIILTVWLALPLLLFLGLVLGLGIVF